MQGRQHSSIQADSCFGDAGGSVWKFWRYGGRRLAVLTGVISRSVEWAVYIVMLLERFEEQCGAFAPATRGSNSKSGCAGCGAGVPDQPNLPTQHTVHSRVQLHLNWIHKHLNTTDAC